MQKVPSIVLAGIIGLGIGYLLSQSTPPPANNQNRALTTQVKPFSNLNRAGESVVRGPYPIDAEGCSVIDLRNIPASEHDARAKTYVWNVDHPTDAPCIRQTNPRISETVVESTNEKVSGTNVWKLTFRYE